MLCAATAAGAQQSASAWPPATTPPIRTVRVGVAHVPAWKENIQMTVTACQAHKALPLVPAQLPSDDALAAFPIAEIEELFDGPRHATYSMGSSIGADATAGCALRVFRRFHVEIELGCTSRIFGGTTLLGELMDIADPKPPDVSLQEEAVRSTRCARTNLGIYDPKGLPVEDASGTPCIWHSLFTARSLAAAGMPVGDTDNNGDLCLYAKIPAVASGKGRQLVVLKTRFSNR